MQHKSIYFPIRQSGYVGKCMNYFNSLNCPETSQRMSERGGRGPPRSVCAPETGITPVPPTAPKSGSGGAEEEQGQGEATAAARAVHGEQRPWAAPCPGRARPPLWPPPADPRKGDGPSQAPRAASHTREQTGAGRAQGCPSTEILPRARAAEGSGSRWHLPGLGQLLGMATASFHWSALETE